MTNTLRGSHVTPPPLATGNWRFWRSNLGSTATHWNTLQHTATQRTATYCNTLQHTATHCNALFGPSCHGSAPSSDRLEEFRGWCGFDESEWSGLWCNTLKPAATHSTLCNKVFKGCWRRLIQTWLPHVRNSAFDVISSCFYYWKQYFKNFACGSLSSNPYGFASSGFWNETGDLRITDISVTWLLYIGNDAVCSSVLQCVAVCCSVLQCVAACCSVLQCVAVCCSMLQHVAACCSMLQHVAVCCSVLQCVAVCCSVRVNTTSPVT